MRRIKVYYSTPIRGVWGDSASIEYIRANCQQGIENVKFLRVNFPDVEWYCPAESDTLIQILFVAGKLSSKDILWGDCQIIEDCDGVLCHKWEASSGVDREFAFARKESIKAMMFEQPPSLGKAGEAIWQIGDFIADIKKMGSCHIRKTERVKMLPKKLEIKPIEGSKTVDIYADGYYLGVMTLDFDTPYEIVERYNTYTNQQAEIDQWRQRYDQLDQQFNGYQVENANQAAQIESQYGLIKRLTKEGISVS